MSEIVIKGELSTQDARVIAMLMDHVTSQLGVVLQEAAETHGLRLGEYFQLQARDVYAPPGRVRALLRDREEVRKLYAGLHGQIIRVGSDQVRVEILNDALNALQGTGNGTGT